MVLASFGFLGVSARPPRTKNWVLVISVVKLFEVVQMLCVWNGDVVDDDRWNAVFLFCGCGVSVCCWLWCLLLCWCVVVILVVVWVCCG